MGGLFVLHASVTFVVICGFAWAKLRASRAAQPSSKLGDPCVEAPAPKMTLNPLADGSGGSAYGRCPTCGQLGVGHINGNGHDGLHTPKSGGSNA